MTYQGDLGIGAVCHKALGIIVGGVVDPTPTGAICLISAGTFLRRYACSRASHGEIDKTGSPLEQGP
jgi:hypothetical protein